MLETGGRCGAVAFLGKVENVAIFPKLYIQILYIKVYSKCFLPVLLAFALCVLHKTTYFIFAFAL